MTALDAAIAAHMAHPAGSLADGLTDSLCDQAHGGWYSSQQPVAATTKPPPAAEGGDFVPTVCMPSPDEQAAFDAAVQAATAKAASTYYVQGARAGRLAGFAWGLALGCAATALAMRLGYATGGMG